MSVHPFEDAVLDRQVELAAEDPDAARDAGVFEVDTLDRANRVLWRVGRLRAQLAEAEAFYGQERDRLEDWIEGERRRLHGQVDFLVSLAEAYHRRLLAEDRRRKTVRLPAGELRARKAQDRWEVTDEATLIEWARANDSRLITERTAVYRPALKKHLDAASLTVGDGTAQVCDPDSGEVVPGVRVYVATDDDLTFTVRTAEVDQ